MRAVTATLLLALLAQDQAQRPPRFRTGVDVVELDVSVLDRDRRPVRGLTAADFTVLEDGQPQDLVAFEEVNLPKADPAGAAWLRNVAPDVRSNDETGGRLLVILLDDATLPADPMVVRTAKEIAREVVARLGPQDLAAVLFTRDNSNSQDFTSDRSRLASAVDKLTFGFIRPPSTMGPFDRPRSTMPGPPRQARAAREDALWYQYSIGTVRRAAEYLRDAPQRRKTLVYISVGIPIEFTPAAAEAGVSSGESDLQRDLAAETQRAFVQAVRSNVTVYGIDPSGLPADDNRLTREFLQALSENTGGFAVVNTNAPGAQVPALMDESGSYYLLGFQSANQKMDGRFRRIGVRVNRPGVTVRSRHGYYGPRAAADTSGARASKELSPLTATIGGVLPKGDLPMRVTVAPFAVPGKRQGALAIVTRLPQPAVTERTQQKIDVLSAAFDTGGKPKGSILQTVNLTLRPGNENSHYEVLSRMDLPQGRYVLRIGAHGAELGKSGSVYYDIDVPDFSKAPVALSGIVLSATPGIRGEPKDALASLMPVVPTTLREFGAEHTVSAFVRVYQGGRKPLLAVSIVVRIADAADREAFGRSETLTAESFSAGRAADYTLELPISGLARGAHVLTIESRAGQMTARRDVRFVVR
jgi:VWFA-related protein